MDKRSILAFILIGIIVTAWLVYTSINSKPPVPKPTNDTTVAKQITESPKPKQEEPKDTIPKEALNDSLLTLDKYGDFFASFSKGNPEYITIETDLVRAKFSSKGAVIVEWELKKYKQAADFHSTPFYQSQLIWNEAGEYFLTFETRDKKKIDSRDLFFKFEGNNQSFYKLKGDDSLVLTARLGTASGQEIIKKFVIYGNKYALNTDITLENMESVVPKGYHLAWDDGLKYQEFNSVDESQEAVAIASMNGAIEEKDASGNDPVSGSYSGLIDFAAVKIKYFTAAIIPQKFKTFDGTVDLAGIREHLPNGGVQEKYSMSFHLPYRGGKQTNSFQ